MDSQYARLFTTPSRRTKKRGVKIVWFGVSERGTQVKDDFTRRRMLMVDNCLFCSCVKYLSGLATFNSSSIGFNLYELKVYGTV